MTRRGMKMRDMNDYLDWLTPRLSNFRFLKTWGECFGWRSLVVRDLDPANLHNADLCADFCQAIGAALPPWSAKRNESPHWLELELARSLCERNGEEEWIGIAQAELEPLVEIMRKLARNQPAIPYLSTAQRTRLIDFYNADLEQIADAGGPNLPRL